MKICLLEIQSITFLPCHISGVFIDERFLFVGSEYKVIIRSMNEIHKI